MFEIAEEAEVKPLGTEFTFTKISQNVATTFLNRDPLKQIHKEGTASSLFIMESCAVNFSTCSLRDAPNKWIGDSKSFPVYI